MSIISTLTLLFSLLFLPSAVPGAQPEEQDNRTSAPFFFIPSDANGLEQMPLKSTTADVTISGVIADVSVTQIYKNEGREAIEAVYVFPASTRAAVHGVKMTIGERTIIARVKERGQARREYEKAVREGKTASLLEQQRPNVFQMTVGNIMPGDRIKVELRYTELLVPTDKVYEFVYPTVVGPRYSNKSAAHAPSSEKWVGNPYLRQGQDPTYSFDIKVNLHAGLPVHEVASPSHEVDVRYDGLSTARIGLEGSEAKGGNRDFILKFRLADRKIQSGLLLHKGEKENYFLLMLQPPKRITSRDIPGREYIFIVDVSGSMHGFPLDISKKLLRDLIGNLRGTDLFNVLLFAGGNSLLSERSLPATEENIRKALLLIDQQRGGGGTELLPALGRALSLPRPGNFSRSIVIATDGYVTVEEQAFDLIRSNLGDANMFAFGIGSSVNRLIIEGMARVGMGEPFVITKPEEAPSQAEAFRRMIESPVLTGIQVDYEGFDVYDLEPRGIPDLLSDRPLMIFGKWRGAPKGSISVKGITGGKDYRAAIDVGTATQDLKNPALRFLWARDRIALLSDYNTLRQDKDRIAEVTKLGLEYNLLTAYTSFVAIDTITRNRDGQTTTVTQPLPLPQGVSDYAVGALPKAAAPTSPFVTGRNKAYESSHGAQPAAALEKAKAKEEERSALRITQVHADEVSAEEEIREAVHRHLDAIDGCAKKSGLRESFILTLTIEKGKVKAVSLKNAASMEKCLSLLARKWKFSPDISTKVTITLSN